MTSIGRWIRGTWLVLLVAAAILFLDQITKGWVRANIEKYTYIIPVPQFDKYFIIEHVHNSGAAFGILQNQNMLLTVIVIVVVLVILIYAARIPRDQRLMRVFLGMQLGGALANLADRVRLGHVTDFIHVGIPGVYYWPSFNIADSAVVLGVIGLGILIIREDIQRERKKKASKARDTAENPQRGAVDV